MGTIIDTFKKYAIFISILMSLIFIFVLKVIGLAQIFTFTFIVLTATLALIYYLNTRSSSKLFWLQYYWVLLAFPVVFFLIGIILFEVGFRNENSAQDTITTLTPDECAPIYNQYNNTVLDITANQLVGSAAIAIEKDTCRATVNYIFQFNADIEPYLDGFSDVESTIGYMINHYSGESRANWTGNGEIGVANINIGVLPEDRFTRSAYEFYNNQQSQSDIGSNFYHSYSRSYLFKGEESLDGIKAKKYYALIDGREYLVTEDLGDGMSSMSLDTEKAVLKAPIVKEFELKYTVVQR